MTEYIDPEELPFTADEIYEAACRFYPEDSARQMDELLPALASLSHDAESRARGIMEERWELARLGDIATQRRVAAERSGLIPTEEELSAQIQRELAESGVDVAALGGLAVSLPELPPATEETIANAAASVDEKRRAWEEMVDRFRDDSPPRA